MRPPIERCNAPEPRPAPASSPAALPNETDDPAALRRALVVFGFLNLGVLALLIGIHLTFTLWIPNPVRVAVSLFAGRAALQSLELAWLRGWFGAASPRTLTRYAHASVWLNVGFACLATLASGMPHSHYIVLVALPIIGAAYRAPLGELVAVVAVAIGVTFVYVGFWQPAASSEDRINECFEEAAGTLTYLAVAVVVRLLVVDLRAEHRRLQRSLRELEQTRDRLIAEEKLGAVGRLSAALAHEVRNPVGMIASAVAAARQANYQPPARDEMYGIVERESRRLEQLTSDFLNFARQTEPQLRPTSLCTTLEYIAALVRPRAAEHRVCIAVNCPADGYELLDADQIQQALLNLAINALEAAPPGSTIALTTSYSDNQLQLSVANVGLPVPPDVQARLAEPLFTTKPRGTGLGLAIARKIARAHGGNLLLTANGPDQVIFSLVLPSRPTPSDGPIEVAHGPRSDR